MVDFGFWGDFALRTWVNINPSPQWANQQIEPFRGLPFGTYLHSARPRRQRTLTGPLDPDDESLWHRLQVLSYLESEQHTDEQTNCGFLSKLPYDIRLMIYEMVLGGLVFHLSAENPKKPIKHYVCNRPDSIQAEGANHTCSDNLHGRPTSPPRNDLQPAPGLLALLLTCRKVYSEAINTLYSANVFEFTQNFAAFTFLKFMIPPQRLSHFRHFRLHMRIPRHPSLNSRASRDWQDLWTFFGKEMCGLQSLYLELQMLQPTEAHIESTPDDEAEDWIKPMVDMALQAYRNRGCRVELETRHMRHYPAQVYLEMSQQNPELEQDECTHLACAALHKRIRVSLG